MKFKQMIIMLLIGGVSAFSSPPRFTTNPVRAVVDYISRSIAAVFSPIKPMNKEILVVVPRLPVKKPAT